LLFGLIGFSADFRHGAKITETIGAVLNYQANISNDGLKYYNIQHPSITTVNLNLECMMHKDLRFWLHVWTEI